MGTPARHRVLPPPTARLLSHPEAAAYAWVSPATFDRMTGEGLMPGPKNVYGRVLWDVRALDAAIDCMPGDGMSTVSAQSATIGIDPMKQLRRPT